MNSHSNGKLVTIFGGTGFVGRHVVRALAKRGYKIRVAVRRPDLAGHLQPLGDVGQIVAVQANVRYPDSIERAVSGSNHVINLVGLLYETGQNTFDSVQNLGSLAIVEAAKAANCKLTHFSAISSDLNNPSDYARTKAMAEKNVLSILPDSIIISPSVIFGAEDSFFNKFASMTRYLPFLPLIGGGTTKFQPVYVGDVAEVVARSVDGQLTAGATYELGGPNVMTFKDAMELMLKVTQRGNGFVSLPWGVASFMGKIMQMIPFIAPPITADQVQLLKSDSVVSEAAEAEKTTLKGLGITPVSAESELPKYLVHYRKQGQYTKVYSK